MKKIKTIMGLLTAMTMTAGAMGVTAYAEENTSTTSEQQANNNLVDRLIEPIKGTLESGGAYRYRPNGTLRLYSEFTADEFYKLVEESTPKFLILADADILGDESEINEWFKKVTGGELGIEGIAVWYRESSPIRDKYNKMIDDLAAEAEANGEKVTPTDLKLKYKLFFYETSTGELSGPDGVICENCHYVNMNEMKAYPNNKGILAAVEGPDYVEGLDYAKEETTIGDIKILARAEQIGDANGDSITNVRDCAFIANALSKGKAETLPEAADYNKDGKKNVRDAAAISKDLASK